MGWIQLWLPLITAMIVASVALVGVLVSNQTNRGVIEAADERSRTELRESRDRRIQWRTAAEAGIIW
jgi:uncharacterized protein (DUF2062 family)